MKKGDIVLITFPFTNLSGGKLRPAVVLFETAEVITVSFITTQIGWQEPNDLLLQPNANNGLKKPSLVRIGKIATLDKTLAKGILGYFSQIEVAQLNTRLKTLLQLP